MRCNKYIISYSKSLFVGVFLLTAMLRFSGYRKRQTAIEVRPRNPPDSFNGTLPDFLIILCDSSSHGRSSSFERQIRQLTVLFKSAVCMSSSTLRFIVVSDSEEVFEKVLEIPSTWPQPYRSRLVFERRSVWYPPDRESMRTLLRPCASGKLFIPETVVDIDSVVFLDTDTLFLKPPEELQMEIFKFNEKQAAGFSQTSQGYAGRRIPYPGPRGVNTGVMVLNLTRLRSLPGGWTGTNLQVFDKYRKQITITATNDIINILLGENPELLFNLNCVWNYGPGVCWRGSNTCNEAETEGAALLHGTSAAFIGGRNPKFKAIFEAWEDHTVGSPIASLFDDIDKRLRADTSPAVRCNKVENLSFIFTEALRKILREE